MLMRLQSPVIVVALICTLIQLASATWVVDDFETPNTSTDLARSLITEGVYGVDTWHRLKGNKGPADETPMRMWHLPGEPLYLAAVFKWFPVWSHRYAHVPFTVLLVVSVTGVALLLYGRKVALVAGLVGALNPFTVIHGPVWDDTFMAAALVWAILWILCNRLSTPSSEIRSWIYLIVLFLLSGWAAMIRMQPQILLAAIACPAFYFKSLQPVRKDCLAILCGLAFAITAWTLRNYVISGGFLAGSSHDGITFWESVYPHAGEAIWTGQVFYLNHLYMQHNFDAAQGLSELEANRYYMGLAITHILDQPWSVARTAAAKILITLGGIRPELPLGSARNLVALSSNLILLLLASLSVPRFYSAHDAAIARLLNIAFTCTVLVTLLLLAIGPLGLRYRIMLDGFLWMLAGVTLCALVSRFKR